MSPRVLAALLVAGAFALGARAQEAYFVRASRVAVVYENHDRLSRELLRLEAGDELNCVTGEQTEAYYHVLLADGATGWVSRYRVRLHEGSAPGAPAAPVAPGVPSGATAAERESMAFHLQVGQPRGFEVLVRPGYVAGYDPRLKIPVWVQYRLTEGRSDDNTFPRTDDFQEDGDVHADGRSTLDDYAAVSSSFVRGHMAPAEDMRWDEDAERLSNLLTNMAPQIGSSFNGSVWKTIENRVRTWAQERDDITVICGPVFEAGPRVAPIADQPETDRQVVYGVVGSRDVAVPTGFFKIVIDWRDPDHPDVIAFLVDHMATVAGSVERDPAHWLRSVDEIERATGLDFLSALPEALQRDVEGAAAGALW